MITDSTSVTAETSEIDAALKVREKVEVVTVMVAAALLFPSAPPFPLMVYGDAEAAPILNEKATEDTFAGIVTEVTGLVEHPWTPKKTAPLGEELKATNLAGWLPTSRVLPCLSWM